MNNYINSRIQAHNNLKIFNAIKHNIRHTQKSLSQENSNFNYIFLKDKHIKITNDNKKELYKLITNEYKKDRNFHNEIYKKHNKRNLTNLNGSWGEGVFTFSEQMKEDLKNEKYSLKDLSKIALECLKDYEAYLGIKTKFMVLHLDEKTPHFQYFFTNFNERGASITHLNKRSDQLSPLQDIAHKHFGKLGLERGLKKDITKASHKSVAQYWSEIEVNLKKKTINLEKQYNNKKIELIDDLKKLYTEVNLQKNEVKELRATHKKTSQEYKDLTIVFKQLQEEENTLRTKVKELKEIDNLDSYLNKLKKDINSIIENNTKEVKPLMGSIKIEINDKNKMYKELVLKISEPLHSKVKEVEEKDKAIKDLNDKLQNKDEVLEKVMTEKYEAIKENKVLKQDNLSKMNEITKLNENHKLEINRLRNDLKRQIALRVKRINLINRLKNSNIAKKIIARLSKRNQNLDLNR
ncbi:hypothetical protein [Aliarcobacter cryaerophilus]|uniref:hypothetical protein n=1 Tax=Aliarcobacter cryaerophilus TaxID=28198 RepID=UPI0021B4D9EB|nr:hypothetical protein [Aliarcobacter cryaerophilus]MCT7517725.1 hypothetical protein [Aliarcobacter cryaerophilus]